MELARNGYRHADVITGFPERGRPKIAGVPTTDPATHRQRETDADPARDAHADFNVSEEARRHNDPTKQVYGAYDDADEAIRNARPPRGDDETIFELEGDVVSSDAVPTQPSHDGIGPFATPVIIVVVALAIFIILLVVLT